MDANEEEIAYLKAQNEQLKQEVFELRITNIKLKDAIHKALVIVNEFCTIE